MTILFLLKKRKTDTFFKSAESKYFCCLSSFQELKKWFLKFLDFAPTYLNGFLIKNLTSQPVNKTRKIVINDTK